MFSNFRGMKQIGKYGSHCPVQSVPGQIPFPHCGSSTLHLSTSTSHTHFPPTTHIIQILFKPHNNLFLILFSNSLDLRFISQWISKWSVETLNKQFQSRKSRWLDFPPFFLLVLRTILSPSFIPTNLPNSDAYHPWNQHCYRIASNLFEMWSITIV